MLGLMKVEDCAKLDAKFKTAIKDLAARDDELDAAEKRIEGLLRDASARAKWNKEISDRLGAAETELATFRAKRDRDNAQRRARHAQKANDAAPKAKKGVRS